MVTDLFSGTVETDIPDFEVQTPANCTPYKAPNPNSLASIQRNKTTTADRVDSTQSYVPFSFFVFPTRCGSTRLQKLVLMKNTPSKSLDWLLNVNAFR